MEGELGSDEEAWADPNKPEYEPGSDTEEPQEVSLAMQLNHLTCRSSP